MLKLGVPLAIVLAAIAWIVLYVIIGIPLRRGGYAGTGCRFWMLPGGAS